MSTDRELLAAYRMWAAKQVGCRCEVFFTCPSCGGNWFGTNNPGSMDREGQRVYCKDQHRTGCQWRGPIEGANDDPCDRCRAGRIVREDQKLLATGVT